ncbi:MAG: hypothetical protein R3B82_11715 [Sandaracinaceae bacterium]
MTHRALLCSLAVTLAACGGATTTPDELPSGAHDGARLAAGARHGCAVTERAGVVCWGSNDHGQLGDGTRHMRSSPVVVSGLDGVVEIATGAEHSCALRRDGTVYCWGAGLRGQLGDGSEGEEAQSQPTPVRVRDLDDAEHLAAGDYHTCALRHGGGVACWGDDAAGQLGDGEPIGGRSAVPVELDLEGVTALAAGGLHTCAATPEGTFCWGQGADGQLGNGGTDRSSFPDRVRTDATFVELALGRAHSCGRTDRGRVLCWGTDAQGQLGDGREGPERALVPRPVEDLPVALDLGAGADHTCARIDTDEIYCWGANGRGQLGDGTLLDAFHPVPGPVSGVELAAGAEHTCVLHDFGMVTCWGDNEHGQLGDGRVAWRFLPAPVRGLTGTTALAAGGHHTCATRGTVVSCWGSNEEGELADYTERATSTPVPAILASEPSGLSLALGRTCVLDEGGWVICSGHGMDPPDRRTTLELGVLGVVRSIAVARDFACALNDHGAIGCWGDNAHGQLGDGTLTSRDVPAMVVGEGDAREIAVGSAHACARLVSGAVYCWGANPVGQLGDGTHEDRSVPTRVEGLDDADALALGRDFSCALRRDGTVSCWGGNRSGQLGDGTMTSRDTPAPVRVVEHATGLAAGWVHACARTEAGQVYCWGENRFGQLGRETEEVVASTPAPASGLGPVTEVACGGLHTCARDEAGRVLCWGDNDHGELGDGVTLLATRPVMARLPSTARPAPR